MPSSVCTDTFCFNDSDKASPIASTGLPFLKLPKKTLIPSNMEPMKVCLPSLPYLFFNFSVNEYNLFTTRAIMSPSPEP